MTDILRPSPRHKRVSLFTTCMVDMIYPPTGIATVKLLDHLGIEVEYREAQTCCAQPAFNAGFRSDAWQIARHFINTFYDADLIVTPSGSCASMVQHYYPELFKDDPAMLEKAAWIASITWELTEYLVDGLGITDLGGKLPPTTVAFHDACHGFRLMNLGSQARALAQAVDGVSVVDLPGSDECCGFGGLFAVKMPEISGAMLNRKIDSIQAVDVDWIVTGDCGCIAQMNGGLSRTDSGRRVTHIADLLAKAIE